MADIRQDTVVSAAWNLMRRAREAGSAAHGSDPSIQVPASTLGDQTYTKEAVRKLIAAYLDTPTQISSDLCIW